MLTGRALLTPLRPSGSRSVRRLALALALAATSTCTTAPALAQAKHPAPPEVEGFLAPDHWARLTLRRAAAEGLAPIAWLGAPWSARLADVRRALAEAIEQAPAGGAVAAALSAALARLEADYGMAPGDAPRVSGRLDLAGSARNGQHGVGLAVPSAEGFEYTRPPAVPDRARVLARVAGFAGAGAFVAGFDIETGERVRQLDLSVRAGPFDIRLGRQPLAFGPGVEEGMVLGPHTSFDGLGIAAAEAFRLPAFLRSLGAVRAALLVARLEASGDVVQPWFAASRISFEPSGSWVIGLNRAVILGGRGNADVSAKRLLLVLFGETDNAAKDSDFENQVASIDLAVRLGGPLALLAYLEYAFDDAGLSFIRVPGILAGVEAGRVPGLGRLAVGAELTAFGGSCCGHPAWYRHGRLAAGWSAGGRPLGHALGGHGGEAALNLRLDPVAGGFLGSARVFVRQRGEENVFAPDWNGASAGGRVRASVPLSPALRMEGRGEFEAGRGWRRWTVDVALGGWFRPGRG